MQSSDVEIPLYVRAISEAFKAVGCEITISKWGPDYFIKTTLPSSGRDEHAFLTLCAPSADGNILAEIELFGSMKLCLSDPQLIGRLESFIVDRLR